jgi:hypothetical protein
MVSPRQRATLEPWLEEYLEARKIDVNMATIAKLNQTRRKLVDYLGTDRPIRSISVTDAAAWWTRLRSCGLSEAARSTSVSALIAEAEKKIKSDTARKQAAGSSFGICRALGISPLPTSSLAWRKLRARPVTGSDVTTGWSTSSPS